MPGLDPGIHHCSGESYTTAMDCRVEPGNDGLANAH
jgi:hypothetical protein